MFDRNFASTALVRRFLRSVCIRLSKSIHSHPLRPRQITMWEGKQFIVVLQLMKMWFKFIRSSNAEVKLRLVTSRRNGEINTSVDRRKINYFFGFVCCWNDHIIIDDKYGNNKSNINNWIRFDWISAPICDWNYSFKAIGWRNFDVIWT